MVTPSTKQNSVIIDSVSKDNDKELDLVGEENVDDGDERWTHLWLQWNKSLLLMKQSFDTL